MLLIPHLVKSFKVNLKLQDAIQDQLTDQPLIVIKNSLPIYTLTVHKTLRLIIRLLLSLLCWPKVILLSGGHCINNELNGLPLYKTEDIFHSDYLGKREANSSSD